MIPITFQAFVRRHGSVWQASPLLSGAPVVQGRDPAVAVDALEDALVKAWPNVDESHRDLLADLGWEPELSTTRVDLPVGSGKLEVIRPLLVATFDVGATRCAVVPRLQRAFVVPKDAGWTEALVRAVRRWRNDLDEDEEAPPTDQALRSERLMAAEIVLRPGIRQVSLSDSGASRWFASLGGGETFSGPEALRRSPPR